MVDNKRALWKYIVFSALTCGIYGLYFIHKLAKDVNIICWGDGQETAGLGKYILFGILTCGIYDLVWLYKVGNRLKANDERYGVMLSGDGSTVILWTIFGSLLCGIGPLVAYNIIIRNTNILAERYLCGDAGYNPIYGASTDQLAALAKQAEEENILNAGGWRCPNCNRINQYCVTTCVCGRSKD